MIQDSLGPNRYSRQPERLSRPARLALIVAAAAAGLVVVGGVAYAGSPNTNTRVVVSSGETLWGIAASHYPGANIEQSIAAIESANHLSGAAIRPGETLTLPAP
jgi:nucleoid-associated protein YgaU